MPDSARATSPFVTMVTYHNTFEVVFPTSDGKIRDDAIALGDVHTFEVVFRPQMTKQTREDASRCG
jgi:hypothetical protein